MPQSSCLELNVLDLVRFGQETDAPFYALRLERPPWESWKPGQFVMLRPLGVGLPVTWARPLSICHMTSHHLICFFQVVGRGTEELSRLRAGDRVCLWGPLGNGFAMEPEKETLLLAGGVGMAPFVGYSYVHPKPWNVSMLFGHRPSLSCYPVDSINERILLDAMQETAPEDRETFIAAMRQRMADCAANGGLALACGPLPFLRTVKTFAAELGLRAQISLEHRMACGVGACLGCVTKTTEAWPVPPQRGWPVQVCNHGPVFWADHVSLE